MDITNKPILKVDKKGSKSVRIAKTLFQVLAWISLIVGVILVLDAAYDYDGNYSLSIIILQLSVFSFFAAAILKGIIPRAEASEYKKAKVEEEYVIKTKDSDGY